MTSQQTNTEGNIPVVCSVCQTRVYVAASHVGRRVRCPDCDAVNQVKPPSQVIVKAPRYTGDEYRLADDTPTRKPVENMIKVVCSTCYTLMHARPEHVGKRVRCPDCDTINVVPRPPATKPQFQAPDVSDVLIESAPPPLVDERRKEIADRLMSTATEDARRKEAERPKPPRDPLREGIYAFPFYPNVLGLWIGTTIAVLADLKLLEALIDIVQAGGYASIIAAFLAPIVAIFTFCILGTVAPHFLTIIEFTSIGYDKVPYWPTQDLLTRGRAVLFGINAFAMSTMPGMLIVGLFRPLGVPLQLGLISTVLLLPLVILSMAENGSVFLPYSRAVFGSLKRQSSSWTRFYVQVILLGIALVGLDFLVWTGLEMLSARAPGIASSLSLTSPTRSLVAQTLACTGFWIYAIIYCRLVGRMAWILGQEVIDDEEDDEEPDGETASD